MCANASLRNYSLTHSRPVASEHTSIIRLITRNAFCGTWYLPHSHIHNERTVIIIMVGCMAHEREGNISTSGLKSDVTIVFVDPDFLEDAGISAIRVHLRQI